MAEAADSATATRDVAGVVHRDAGKAANGGACCIYFAGVGDTEAVVGEDGGASAARDNAADVVGHITRAGTAAVNAGSGALNRAGVGDVCNYGINAE